MEKKTISSKTLRERKLLMVLPALVLPFITLMFWALGGGKAETRAAQTKETKGFNTELPSANFKDEKPLDKMSYYNRAASDSARLNGLLKNDPNYHGRPMPDDDIFGDNEGHTSLLHHFNNGRAAPSPDKSNLLPEINEEKIYRKLAQIDEAMNKMDTIEVTGRHISTYDPTRSTTGNIPIQASDVDRLEQMIQTMNQPGEKDSEMEQLNTMLEKIMDIQHPEKVIQKLKEISGKNEGQILAVSATAGGAPVSFLGEGDNRDTSQNGFYSLDKQASIHQAGNAIQAIIHETETIVNGSTIKLRLLHDIYVQGKLIPRNTFLFGQGELQGERLFIKINSIYYNNSLFPVRLSVYDMDGRQGVYVPGTITRDAAKESTDRAIQSLGMTALDPSVGAQAAGAGIEAARNLLSKKVRLVKVTVEAGYQVLLKDEKQNN